MGSDVVIEKKGSVRFTWEARATISSGDRTLATNKRILLPMESIIFCMVTISVRPCNSRRGMG